MDDKQNKPQENAEMPEKALDAVKGIYDSLTDEQKEKAKACKSMEELTALAGKEGIELPDEVLDTVAGGYGLGGPCNDNCYPNMGC